MPRFEQDQGVVGPGKGESGHWPTSMGAGHPPAPVFSPEGGEVMVVQRDSAGRQVIVFFENDEQPGRLDWDEMNEADFEELAEAYDGTGDYDDQA